MIYAKIGILEWRKVVQALKLFIGVENVCAYESRWRVLGRGANEIFTDTFYHYKPHKSAS